jgi:hypothetical protein
MLQFVNTEVSAPADGAWKGTLRAATVNGASYTLSGDKFVRKSNASVSANQAYYVAALDAATLPIALENGGETGIDDVEGADGKGVFYDLGGRRVAKPESGIYVLNGKKVLVK